MKLANWTCRVSGVCCIIFFLVGSGLLYYNERKTAGFGWGVQCWLIAAVLALICLVSGSWIDRQESTSEDKPPD